jgi:heme/copper-type cytochrome/quinol oxidase subunit 2
MQDDTLIYDSAAIRPLPKWLTDQKAGLTAARPPEIVIRDDKSLGISFALTGIFIIIVVAVLTVYITRKHKKNTI